MADIESRPGRGRRRLRQPEYARLGERLDSFTGRGPPWYPPSERLDFIGTFSLNPSQRSRGRGPGGVAIGGGSPGRSAPCVCPSRRRRASIEQFKDSRGRHRLARSPDRAPLRADQRPHRSLQDSPEGPSLPARPAHAHRQAPRAARVPPQEGRGALPGIDRKARDPQVIGGSRFSISPTARPAPGPFTDRDIASRWRTHAPYDPSLCPDPDQRHHPLRSRPARSPSRPTARSSSAAAAPWCCPPSSSPGPPWRAATSCRSPSSIARSAYAGGKIPGGFFKREGRPDEKETLTCRLIDRPMRPLFPKGFRNEIQIINLVISADNEQRPRRAGHDRLLGRDGAVRHPVRRARSGRCGWRWSDGKLVANPTYAQLAARRSRS